MLPILIALGLAAATGNPDPALAPCKAALERKAGGQIDSIDVQSVHVRRNGRTISGRLTSFAGMSPPPLGSASAHHLIRAEFSFTCRVAGGRVREARLNPVGG